jgi:hypothetical protein
MGLPFSHCAADLISAQTHSVKLPVKGMKSSEKFWQQ